MIPRTSIAKPWLLVLCALGALTIGCGFKKRGESGFLSDNNYCKDPDTSVLEADTSFSAATIAITGNPISTVRFAETTTLLSAAKDYWGALIWAKLASTSSAAKQNIIVSMYRSPTGTDVPVKSTSMTMPDGRAGELLDYDVITYFDLSATGGWAKAEFSSIASTYPGDNVWLTVTPSYTTTGTEAVFLGTKTSTASKLYEASDAMVWTARPTLTTGLIPVECGE